MENGLSTELPELMDFFGLKKKKKVKFSKDDLDWSQKREDITIPMHTITIEDIPEEADNFDNDLSFDLTKKKKKKKVNVEEDTPDEMDLVTKTDTPSLIVGDAEYTYEDLLALVFSIMREKDPNRDVENRKKMIMKPPQCIRIGTKKTSFVNFLEICKMMHRTPQHLQQFLLVELGTTGSLDGNYQLIIKGRFGQKQIENVLRRYIKEYVTCHTCKSPDTVLQKDTRLFFLQCQSCGSRCSVTSVKSGFQAVTSKRAALRAKGAAS